MINRHRPAGSRNERASYALPQGSPALQRQPDPRALLIAGTVLLLLGLAAGFALGCRHADRAAPAVVTR